MRSDLSQNLNNTIKYHLSQMSPAEKTQFYTASGCKDTAPDRNVPTIRLLIKSDLAHPQDTTNPVSTRTLLVECDFDDRSAVEQLLMSVTKADSYFGCFMNRSMAIRNDQVSNFHALVIRHNKLLTEHKVIPIAGISPTQMDAVQPSSDFTTLRDSHCQSIVPLDAIPATLTMEQFLGKLRVWNENTSTSPSGRHLGHYKALLRSLPADDPDFDTHEEQRLALLQAHLDVLNYCLIHGFVLSRWKNIVNVMILKEPGNTKIHRLRVIHIYEADYNLILSVKWRQLMKHTEAHKLIHDGQFGGRPGREAIGLTLLEELKNDISHLSRKALVNMDNDAASCYDRIIPSLASLINRRYGLHRNAVLVNARTLQEASYKIKTELGVSVTEYSNCTTFPLYGTGQGSGNSPVIWCFISSTLFDCYDTKAYGAVFSSPDKTVTVRFSIVGFVDDSTCSTNAFFTHPQPTPELILNQMKLDTQLWNDLLWCSGGMLELPKCSYHFLYFDFLPDGSPSPRLGTVGQQMTVDDPQGQPITIPSKSVYETHKTLGHYKCPAGNGGTQLQKLCSKMNSLSQTLTSCPASRSEATIFYETIYIPSIFVLGQCFFSPKELDNAEKKSMPSIFAKQGYNRKTCRKLLYGLRRRRPYPLAMAPGCSTDHELHKILANRWMC